MAPPAVGVPPGEQVASEPVASAASLGLAALGLATWLAWVHLASACGKVAHDNDDMMMTFITAVGEGLGKTNKKRKATKSKGTQTDRG